VARHEVKVDENLPREVCDLLSAAGHDALSVGQQGLIGAGDARIYRLCQDEQRALVTLDVDFANPRAYEPGSSAGVIVLRLARQDKQRTLDALTRTLPVLEREPLAKRLWVVEEHRIRIRA
jgi:predicted nuclease of predicted toxin-antitoxin system